jgi:hypothetical protein
MPFEYICLGTIGSYYCCHCYIFIKTLINENIEYVNRQTANTTSEAEQLIQHNQTNIMVHENNFISLPEIDMQTNKIELSFTQDSNRSRYRPTQSFISMNEPNMLDVLYE